MKTIKLNLYSFDELDERAKEKATEHFRDVNLLDDWWDFVFDDFISLAQYLGISVYKKSIAFQGFYFQGSGSRFSAEVDLKTLVESIALKRWQEYAPQIELNLSVPHLDHRVLALAVNKITELNPGIIGRTRCYEVVADLGGYPFEQGRQHDLVCGELDKLERWLEGIAQTLNKSLFKLLEQNYDYLAGDEAVGNAITAMEHRFTADGKHASRLEELALINN